MMKELFVGSTTRYAGKTMVALGILDYWKNRGLNIGYFKPIGKNFTLKDDVKVEEDVLLIRERFSLTDDLSVMCPLYLDYQDYISLALGKLGDAADRIYGGYEQVKQGKDALLVGGGADMHDGFSVGVSNIDFVIKYDMPLVLVDAPVFGDVHLDSIIAVRDRCGERLTGVVFNHLSPESIGFTEKYYVPYLEKRGIDVWGLIPEEPMLHALSVGEMKAILGGRLICCEDRKEEPVENFMVGAMNVEAALKHFRSQANKAVITGGDRADIQMAALETPTKLLVLTGNMYPDSAVISAAQEKGVPILVVADDTMTTVEKMDAAVRNVGVRGKRVADSITVFQRHIDTGYLDKLGG